MTFLSRIVSELLSQSRDLSQYALVLPGKRPIVFIRRLLEQQKYSGFLPDFYTIEELVAEIAGQQELKGIALWLFAYEVYHKMVNDEDFASFLKWFPTVAKDWDDMLKFAESDKEVLRYMLDEERIKNWGQDLGEDHNTRKRNLDFWKKMNIYLPELKQRLCENGWATSGMVHEIAREKIADFAGKTDKIWIFCGFNAFTPTEEQLVHALLQNGRGQCFFQADEYYMEDERQEAGKFLREHRKWKEFNDSRPFSWVENDFEKPKNINVFEVSGNITQTKILPNIFADIPENELSETAVVLLDENLLPASLDALSSQKALNITMGFPLKNLAFSNAIKKLFYIQKQQEKKQTSYYYNDILAVLESLPHNEADRQIVQRFYREIQDRNIVYISKNRLQELLSGWSYIQLLMVPEYASSYLDLLIEACQRLKAEHDDDILYENISHFEKSFRIIRNQTVGYSFEIKIETLEMLVNQLVNTETLDFQGEPLQGLQIMGLLETRLLNFKNVILLSVNEGKLPLGNTQNTYLPFDVRKIHNLHTYLDNDSIYAYHFYRFLQGAENIYLLFNALSSGVNTGEKSRFITQIEMESTHRMHEVVIENQSEPIVGGAMLFPKSDPVMQLLQLWKSKVSASHLTAYLRNPAQFYINYILKAESEDEIEEELSQKNYGSLVHYALEVIYKKYIDKKLSLNDLENSIKSVDEALDYAILKINHQPEFYDKGMNFIHKSIAKKVVTSILNYDLSLLRDGHSLEIIDVERKFGDVNFKISDEDSICFYGFIDRIDRLDGQLRVIDYKTGKAKKLGLKFSGKEEELLMKEEYKQGLQLCIYLYYTHIAEEFNNDVCAAGIWSFAEVNKGVQQLTFEDGSLETALISIRNLILEILDPDIPFEEKIQPVFEY